MCTQRVGECFTGIPITREKLVIFNILSFWEVITVPWPLVSETPVLEPAHMDVSESLHRAELAFTAYGTGQEEISGGVSHQLCGLWLPRRHE